MTWHLDPHAIARYGTGVARGADAASTEAHLVRCAACRAAVAPYADTARLDRVFADVVDAVGRPRPRGAERVLRALRVPDGTARIVAATPALRVSWLLAVLAALAFAVLAAHSGDGTDVFVVLAPVLPVLGVAIAYGPGFDPAYEIAVAAPFGGLRLVLLRAGAVLGTTAAATAAVSWALPGGLVLGAWLLPALALCVTTLAAGTAFDPVRAAALVGGSWLLVTITALRRDLDVSGPGARLLCLLLLLAAAAVLAVRHDRYERGAPA